MRKVIKNNLFMIKTVFKHSPMLVVYTLAAAAFLASVQVFAQLIFLRRILQGIENGETFERLAVIILIGLGILLFFRGGHAFLEKYFIPAHSEKLKKGFELYLYKKVSSFDLSCYDDAEFFDNYIWTMHNATDLILKGMKAVGESLHKIFHLVGTVIIIFSVDYIMAIIIAVSVVLSIIINMAKDKAKLRYKKALVPSDKKKKYIERLFYLKDSAKDIRLTSIKNKFNSFYNEAYSDQEKINKKMTPRIAFLSFLPVFFFRYFISTFAVYSYFAYRLIVENNLLISDFVVVTKGLGSLYLVLIRLSGNINALYNNSIFIESMKSFLEYEPRIKTISDPEEIDKDNFEIEFINVSFRYPGQNDYTLKNVSFKIPRNKSLAIVGYNGAGKTTLIKLLLRLYEVQEGKILLNGIDIRKYDLLDYRKQFIAVFQDFQIYAASIGENIMMDNFNASDVDKIKNALGLADFDKRFKKVDKGLDAQMTREFDKEGVLLSGGEEQKLAISRVFARESKIAVFDEPTAALDPIAEYKLNSNIHKETMNRSLILISHRLTSTLMADNIIMLVDGEIVEEGSHDELMALNNHYSEIYMLQASKYLSNHT